MEVSQCVCGANAWYGFLLRFFLIKLTQFNYRFSCVKKSNCPIVSSEIALGRDSFSCGDWSVGKQYILIDWFLYAAPYSIGFLKSLSESFINNLCI